ncbi:hypothetical protein pb186bvf_012716 [Paramecium bursaria]
MQALSDYISHFIEQQRCFRHSNEKAKMIKLKCNFKESFICSQCIETDSKSQMMTLKRALDMLNNFILFENTPVENKSTLLKGKLQSFFDQVSNQLTQLETSILEYQESMNQQHRAYQTKITELERLQKHLTNISQSKTADINMQIQLTDNLKSSLLFLLQSDSIIYQYNSKQKQNFQYDINNQYEIIESLLNEASQKLLIREPIKISRNNSRADFKSLSKSHSQTQLFMSTFTSMTKQQTFTFRSCHPEMKILTPNKLQIPIKQGEHTKKLRLAYIAPRLQEGPLKPAKSITFSIDAQIMQNLQVGVCEMGQVEFDPKRPHKLFCASKFPFFNRGDQITLHVNPATSFIQLIKNKLNNQPLQEELPLECWTNMMFVVASIDNGGGGEITIIDEQVQL